MHKRRRDGERQLKLRGTDRHRVGDRSKDTCVGPHTERGSEACLHREEGP